MTSRNAAPRVTGEEATADATHRPDLPPPVTVPPDRTRLLAGPGRRAGQIVDELAAGRDVFTLVRTGTRRDVGFWFYSPRVCIAALQGELLVFCASRRHCAETVPFASLHGSRYNHVTGELLLAPAEELSVRRFRVSPLMGMQLLAQIYKEERQDA